VLPAPRFLLRVAAAAAAADAIVIANSQKIGNVQSGGRMVNEWLFALPLLQDLRILLLLFSLLLLQSGNALLLG
jgi:hypothetical protein